jgi:hypothetical protein
MTQVRVQAHTRAGHRVKAYVRNIGRGLKRGGRKIGRFAKRHPMATAAAGAATGYLGMHAYHKITGKRPLIRPKMRNVKFGNISRVHAN